MSQKQLSFKNSGGETLSAILELPIDQKPHNYALFAHCFTCSKNFKAVRYISKALSAQGFGVLSFDFTGLGASEGEFADTNFSSSVDDLLCAADYLTANFGAPSLIVGHSLGGAAAILAAKSLESATAVVTIGSPANPDHVKRLIESGIEEINKNGEARISIGGRPFTVKKQFVDDLEHQKITAAVGRMKKSFLFLHSPQDTIVGIENAGALYASAKHPKSFVSLEGADHLLSNPEDARYAGSVIATWAERYVERPAVKALPSGGHVIAYLGSDEKFTTEIKVNQHRLIADEPIAFGGNDFGPGPYELVASGLAACTVMTLRMYADRKKWNIEELYCHVRHEKTHAADCVDCENPKAKIDKFTRELEIIGNLNEEQLKRILEIADKCPVHRTLESKSIIETVLIDG